MRREGGIEEGERVRSGTRKRRKSEEIIESITTRVV